MPSPAVPLSVEYAAIAGVTGALVSMVTLSAARGRTGIAGHIGGRCRQAVGAVGERGRRIGPVAAAVGGGAAEQRDAVIDLDRGIGFRAAGERQGIVIGDAIASRAAVGRVRGNRRGDRGAGVDGDAQRTRGRTGIAGDIGGGRGQAVGAVGERGRGDSSRPLLPLAVADPSSVAPS